MLFGAPDRPAESKFDSVTGSKQHGVSGKVRKKLGNNLQCAGSGLGMLTSRPKSFLSMCLICGDFASQSQVPPLFRQREVSGSPERLEQFPGMGRRISKERLPGSLEKRGCLTLEQL